MSDDNSDKSSEQNSVQNDDDFLTSDAISKGPWLWFLLLAVPFVFGLISSFDRATSVDDAIEVQQNGAQVEVSEKVRRVAGGSLRMIGMRNNAARSKASKGIFCPTKALNGAAYSEEIEGTLKASKRPYRIIDRLKYYDDDYIPNRINLRLDRKGKIEAVWCG